MDVKIFEKNLTIIQKQRNMLIIVMFFSLLMNLVLVIKNLFTNQRIILTPGLNQSVWIENNSVSGSYIEEISILFLSHLLDISAKNLAYKRSLILHHVSSKTPKSQETINRYFLEVEAKYKKFDLSTYFTIKDIIIDADNLTAKATGILTSHYGKRALDVSEEEYLLAFELVRGNLKLKSFENIKNAQK